MNQLICIAKQLTGFYMIQVISQQTLVENIYVS